jgi:hypothetical protein
MRVNNWGVLTVSATSSQLHGANAVADRLMLAKGAEKQRSDENAARLAKEAQRTSEQVDRLKEIARDDLLHDLAGRSAKYVPKLEIVESGPHTIKVKTAGPFKLNGKWVSAHREHTVEQHGGELQLVPTASRFAPETLGLWGKWRAMKAAKAATKSRARTPRSWTTSLSR